MPMPRIVLTAARIPIVSSNAGRSGTKYLTTRCPAQRIDKYTESVDQSLRLQAIQIESYLTIAVNFDGAPGVPTLAN
jgi:hypothetical protein